MEKARTSGHTYTLMKVWKEIFLPWRDLTLIRNTLKVGNFYNILFDEIVSGKQPASGREGFYFLESGEYRQRDAAEAIAKALHKRGKIESPKAAQLTEGDLGDEGDKFNFYRLEMGNNSRARGDRSRQLGWKPPQTTEEFYESILADVDYCLSKATPGSSSH